MSDTLHTVCIEFCGGPFCGFVQLAELHVGNHMEFRLWTADSKNYHHYESDDVLEDGQAILYMKYRGVLEA
jgi:hypothetical protein